MDGQSKLDRVVAEARRNRDERDRGYRERALKMYPWVCGRCSREFERSNLRELTVHHRNHDHDYNPEDGSNWELLCLYCHDNEHARREEALRQGGGGGGDDGGRTVATHNPFAALGDLLGKGEPDA